MVFALPGTKLPFVSFTLLPFVFLFGEAEIFLEKVRATFVIL